MGHNLQNWDELRTAYHVARLGTVSGAANVLGVHHATVIRHIDSVEEALKVKLFQRHARGYTPTEAGHDMMQVVERLEDQVYQMVTRLQGNERDLVGELILTFIGELSEIILPIAKEFRDTHPNVRLRLMASEKVMRLETGEAHVALRAGPKPDATDSVIEDLGPVPICAYAHKDYVESEQIDLDDPDLIKKLSFISNQNRMGRPPHHAWIEQHVPSENVSLSFQDESMVMRAITSGLGVGFLPEFLARNYDDIVKFPFKPTQDIPHLWVVTHFDLQRSSKVAAMVELLQERIGSQLKS